jgi:nucleoside-diphosphate-sugar epimerase
VVILGRSRFVGTKITKLLVNRVQDLQIADLRESETFPELAAICDVRDLIALHEVVKGAETTINLAAEYRDDVGPLSLYDEVNLDGAARVCEVAREAGVKQIIFTSSVAVYGFQPRPTDEQGPYEPFNDYGRTKLAAEAVYKAWAAEDPSRSLVIVRPTVVFGEGNRGNVYNLLRQISTGKFMMVGTGRNKKSMAYVGNIAAFLAHCLTMGPGVHIYNYVDGPDMSTADLVEHVWRCLGKEGRPTRMPRSVAMAAGRGFDVLARVSGKRFPISAIRVRKFCESTQFRADRIAETGFTPPYTLAEGLARTIEHEFLAR